MLDKIKNGLKGVRRYMGKKVEACKEILVDARNRAILGFIILGAGVGLGGGLIVSAYAKLPA